MLTELPTGRRGQAMALGLTLLVLAAVWCAAVVPLWGWYEDRAEQLRERRAYATRMAALAAQVPALRRRAASLGGTGPSPDSILRGDTDAIAGAALQDAVRSLAGRQGITLASTETLPAAPLSHYRRIGVRISLAAPIASWFGCSRRSTRPRRAC